MIVRARRRRAAWVAAAVAALAGCGAPRLAFDRVVLVTLDTTRADHLGAYGYPRATSPFFDELASRGLLFERAIAPMSETVPAHATMFTSLYPLEHGVGHNGRRLASGPTTAAELLGDAGYATAAFVSLGLLRQSGLKRGFATFEYRGSMRSTEGPPACDARATTDAAIEWLRGRLPADRRFFVWVHYYDPHTPWAPPAEAREAVRRESGPIDAVESLLRERHGIGLAVHGGDRARMLDAVDRYDGELRAMDDQLRRLYAAFVELGLAEGSAWIIAGDHGEGLGSHDWLEHSSKIYQEQIRSPLLLHAPGRAGWTPRRIDDVVELTDLLPTLAEFASRRPPEGSRGSSLLGYLGEAPVADAEREALSQRRTYDRVPERLPRAGKEGVTRREEGERLALVGRRWKYLHWTAGPPELYDLEVDPLESRNLAASEPAIVAAMRDRLLARAREMRAMQRDTESADERTLELLRSLGYVQ